MAPSIQKREVAEHQAMQQGNFSSKKLHKRLEKHLGDPAERKWEGDCMIYDTKLTEQHHLDCSQGEAGGYKISSQENKPTWILLKLSSFHSHLS